MARASHRLNLVAGIVVALLPGLWTLLWNLATWPTGLATLSNICLSLQLVLLGFIVCAHWTTFNFCVYDPMRDWLENYTVRVNLPPLRSYFMYTSSYSYVQPMCIGIHVPIPRPCGDDGYALVAEPRQHAMERTDISASLYCESAEVYTSPITIMLLTLCHSLL